MRDDLGDAPALLPPARQAVASSWRAVGAFGLAAVLAGLLGIGLAPRTERAEPAGPYTRADLGSTLVTPVDPTDSAAVRRALSQLRLDGEERGRVSAGLESGRWRLGILAFYDDEDPDGDAVAVRGAGFSQTVTLMAGLTPVVVPYEIGSPIEITAVADGGDIVTVAMMTRSGPMHLKRLLRGETVGVATR